MAYKMQQLLELREVVSRFPTGQMRKSKAIRMEWCDMSVKCYEEKDGKFYCSPSSKTPQPWNKMVKEN